MIALGSDHGGFDLKEAVNDNIVLVLLTGLFVYLAFLNIVD